MNKTILVSKINPQDDTQRKRRIFFLLGDMKKEITEEKVINILIESELVKTSDIILKYDGIDLNICTKDIPNVVRVLCKADVKIYAIYQFYDPEL